MTLLFVLCLNSAVAGEYSSPEQVLAEFKGEPTIAEVQAMALDYSKTDPKYLDGWLRAAKSAAALPKVTLYYNQRSTLDNDFGYYSSEELIDDGDGTLSVDDAQALAYGPFETDQSITDYYQGYGKLEWKLSDLVMSSNEIRVINEAQDIVKLRDKVMEDVTRLYFERRRVQVDQLLGSGGGDVKKRVVDQLRLAELTAQLDAYTGGRFSAAVKAPAK